ncbi:hypothetical protein [Pseudoalteromonas sp. S2721]|uniref:hypothetical protein n=1 Tax=Pseudoalteromonas sp. S2721 TaxID=579526 RepID=UPI001BB24D22|nr:hypothetical protein [Pseudoalteromonas sp. S2721]
MAKDNQKEKVRSVFNYKYFQIALAVPLALGCTLMILIWQNDNLSFERPSKESLETFLTYMSVPLWIMGSAIPFATLAAANFRAIQFQENLNYQKRNIERQEYEHKLDLYHKELVLFKEKFEAAINNGGFKLIRANDATSIYCRFYLKPKSKDDAHNTIDQNRVDYIFTFFINFEKKVFAIAKEPNINKMKYEIIKYIIDDKDNKFLPDICMRTNSYKVKIIILLSTFENVLKELCDVIGIKHYSMFNSSLTKVIELITEILALQRSLLDSGDSKYNHFFSFNRQSHLIEILNLWIKQSQIKMHTEKDTGYQYKNFIDDCRLTYTQIKNEKAKKQ